MARCDYCNIELPKRRKRFCCDKHKDRYHNETNPRGIFAHLNYPIDTRSRVNPLHTAGQDDGDSEYWDSKDFS